MFVRWVFTLFAFKSIVVCLPCIVLTCSLCSYFCSTLIFFLIIRCFFVLFTQSNSSLHKTFVRGGESSPRPPSPCGHHVKLHYLFSLCFPSQIILTIFFLKYIWLETNVKIHINFCSKKTRYILVFYVWYILRAVVQIHCHSVEQFLARVTLCKTPARIFRCPRLCDSYGTKRCLSPSVSRKNVLVKRVFVLWLIVCFLTSDSRCGQLC